MKRSPPPLGVFDKFPPCVGVLRPFKNTKKQAQLEFEKIYTNIYLPGDFLSFGVFLFEHPASATDLFGVLLLEIMLFPAIADIKLLL